MVYFTDFSSLYEQQLQMVHKSLHTDRPTTSAVTSLCHVFCIPRQLIRVCNALPTTILLGDGRDRKDWRGDIFANPPVIFSQFSHCANQNFDVQ